MKLIKNVKLNLEEKKIVDTIIVAKKKEKTCFSYYDYF